MSSDGSDSSVTGRTGYDVLFNSKFLILGLLFLGTLVAVSYFYRSEFLSLLSSVVSFGSLNYPYALPIFAGLYVGRHIYLKYIRGGVLLQIENLSGNATTIDEVSRIRFSKMIPEDGAFNPKSTSEGKPLYVCKSVDYESNIINLGDCHLVGEDPVFLATYRNRFYAWFKDYRKKCIQVVELQTMPFVVGSGIGKKVVKKHLEIISPVDLQEPVVDDKGDDSS